MDFAKVLAQLREELQNLDTAIESLERLQQGGKRRGRPPAWIAQEKRPRSKMPPDLPSGGRKSE